MLTLTLTLTTLWPQSRAWEGEALKLADTASWIILISVKGQDHQKLHRLVGTQAGHSCLYEMLGAQGWLPLVPNPVGTLPQTSGR